MSQPVPSQGLGRRTELLLGWAAVLIGGLLRGWQFTRLGLSHFDEGVYAFAGLWPWTGQFPTEQAFYSPPVYPLLVGLSGLVWGGPTDLAAPSVSWLMGTASILLVWGIARCWRNPETGVCAAWLVSLDGFQIGLSRIGLTDATFQFGFLLSLLLLREAVTAGDRRWILAAGLTVGFTWNTKYNGFLPLLLSVGWIPLALPSWRHGLFRISQSSLISLSMYLPWAVWFHVKHGYVALVAHQRGYWIGVSGLKSGWQEALLGMETVGSFPVLILVLAGWSLWFQTGRRRVASVWITAWLVLLPAMYTPYLRLWAPTELWLLLLAADGLLGVWSRIREGAAPLIAAAVVAGALALSAGMEWSLKPPPRRSPLPEATAGYRETGEKLAAWLKENRRLAVVLVRPPLLFYLAQRGVPVVRLPDGPIPPLRPSEVLVLDRALSDSARAAADWKTRQSGFREAARFAVEPSIWTQLDDHFSGRLPAGRGEYDAVVFEAKGR